MLGCTWSVLPDAKGRLGGRRELESRNRPRPVFFLLVCYCALAAAAPGFSAAQIEVEAPPEHLLIRNVLLVGREGQAEDQLVSILIKSGKLDLVSPDEIPLKKTTIVIDGEGGTLLGKLTIGAAPSFLILDQNPREFFEVLLDTNSHARFALHDGQIIRNLLPTHLGSAADSDTPPLQDPAKATDTPEAPEEEPKKDKPPKPKRPRWLAYTPPPVALPITYDNHRKWNLLDTKRVSSLFTAAALLDRQRWLSQNTASRDQFGDLSEFEGGEIRAFRFGLIGTLKFKRPWFYTVFVATNAFDKGFDTETTDDLTLFDFRLDIPLSKRIVLSLGKQKETISMERIMTGFDLPFQERAAVSDALLPSRNVGAVVSGTIADRRMTWAFGAFNDWFDTDVDFSDSSMQVTGRITGLPFLSEDESHLFHLGLGVRRTNAKEGVRYRADPEFNLAPDFVDTGLLVAGKAVTYDFEMSWRRGPLWIGGEFLRSDVDTLDLGRLSFGGYYVSAAWSLSGEMRKYNRKSGTLSQIQVAQSVDQGGWGAWEIAARWSDLDLSDRSVDGGEMQIFSLGLNWLLTDTFYFNANYRDIQLDRFGLLGRSNSFLVRVVLLLE